MNFHYWNSVYFSVVFIAHSSRTSMFHRGFFLVYFHDEKKKIQLSENRTVPSPSAISQSVLPNPLPPSLPACLSAEVINTQVERDSDNGWSNPRLKTSPRFAEHIYEMSKQTFHAESGKIRSGHASHTKRMLFVSSDHFREISFIFSIPLQVIIEFPERFSRGEKVVRSGDLLGCPGRGERRGDRFRLDPTHYAKNQGPNAHLRLRNGCERCGNVRY